MRKESPWGRDALEFRPERFLNEKEPSPFKYSMFNAAQRICLGRPLALMNMKLAMSILLSSKFDLTDKRGHSGEYLWTLVQSMKDGTSRLMWQANGIVGGWVPSQDIHVVFYLIVFVWVPYIAIHVPFKPLDKKIQVWHDEFRRSDVLETSSHRSECLSVFVLFYN